MEITIRPRGPLNRSARRAMALEQRHQSASQHGPAIPSHPRKQKPLPGWPQNDACTTLVRLLPERLIVPLLEDLSSYSQLGARAAASRINHWAQAVSYYTALSAERARRLLYTLW